jgi:hypothetical protein
MCVAHAVCTCEWGHIMLYRHGVCASVWACEEHPFFFFLVLTELSSTGESFKLLLWIKDEEVALLVRRRLECCI